MKTFNQPFIRILTVFLFIISCAFLPASLKAQAPDGINYQAVARDNNGNVLDNRLISVRFAVFADSPNGNLLHEEEYSQITTNDFGLFNLVIGRGGRIGGSLASFAAINWGNTDHYLRVQIDAGSGFENLGTTQLLSVPYALYAKNAEIDPRFLARFIADSTRNADSIAALRFDLNNISFGNFDARITADSIRLEAFIAKMRNDSISIANALTILRTDVSSNNTQIINLNNRFVIDSTNVADSLAAIRQDLNNLKIIDFDPRIVADSIRLENLKAKLILDSTAFANSLNSNTANIASNLDSITNLGISLLARINADSLLRYINDTTLRGELRDTAAVLRNLINSSNTDDQQISFNATRDSILLEDGGGISISDIRDSLNNYNLRINSNQSDIAANTSTISANTLTIANNAQGIIDSTSSLSRVLSARINADSLLRYINDTSIRGEIRDTSAVLRNLINSSNTDDQQISFNATRDSILLEDGGGISIADIRDSLNNYDTRMNTNQIAIAANQTNIASNSSNISTNATNISNNTQRIIDSVSNLNLSLRARINADSLLRYINDTSIRGEIRDTSAVLRTLINSTNTDDQQISFNATRDSILIEDGSGISIADIRDSLNNYDTRMNSNQVAIATNQTNIAANSTAISTNTLRITNNAQGIIDSTSNLSANLLARINADSLLRYINDTSIRGEIRDTSAVLRTLINSTNTDDQQISFNATKDSILLEDGSGISIADIRDSLNNYNLRISANETGIISNSTNIASNLLNITNLSNRFVSDSANTANQLDLVDSTRIRNGSTDVLIPTPGDSILFRINGVKRFKIDENGRSIFSGLVGIGTPTPPAHLSTFSNNNGIPSANLNTLGGDAPAEGLIMRTNGVANDAFGINSSTFGGSNSIGIRSIARSTSSSLSDSSVAVYARASGTNNVYSGFFDRGDVFIRESLILPNGANNGYVLTSDANGVASWQLPASGGNVNTAGGNTVNRLAYWNDTDSITFFDDLFVDLTNNRVGIGTTNPTQKLQVNGGIRVSGGFNANNGTQGAPSFRFETDANTGMFGAAPDQLGFTTGGTEAMRIDNNGRLGIGLNVPDSLLDVAGGARVQALNINSAFSLPTSDGATNQVMRTDGSGRLTWGTVPGDNLGNHIASTNIELNGNFLSGDGDNEGIFVDNSGNVGIGTTTPSAPLTINTVGTSDIVFTGISNADITASTQLNIITTATAFLEASEVRLRTNTLDRLTVLNNGNVGIGTLTPAGKMEVAGDGSLIGGLRVSGTLATTVGSSIYLDAATKDWTITATNSASGAGNNKLVFRDFTSAADRMTIDDVGNVGIGITSPNTRLQVHATSGAGNLRLTSVVTGTNNTDGFLMTNDGGSQFVMRQFENADWVFATHTGANAITIAPNANVGIGTTTPNSRLEVVGDIEIPAANNYTYSTAKTHYQSFAPTTFNSLLPDLYSYGTNLAIDFYGYFRSGGTAFGYSTVEVNLPDGANVTDLEGWIYDNLTTNPVRLELFRQQLGSSVIQLMVSIESSVLNASTVVQNLTSNTVFNSLVDNANYAYFLRFTGRQNSIETRLYGARITYTVSETD